MRLDANRGDTGWLVWHVERCEVVRACIWVDDETRLYGVHVIKGRSISERVIQARAIRICAHARTVLINPVDDVESDWEMRTTAVSA